MGTTRISVEPRPSKMDIEPQKLDCSDMVPLEKRQYWFQCLRISLCNRCDLATSTQSMSVISIIRLILSGANLPGQGPLTNRLLIWRFGPFQKHIHVAKYLQHFHMSRALLLVGEIITQRAKFVLILGADKGSQE